MVDYKCQPEAVKKYLRHFKQLHIKERFYWPGMATDVALWVSRCGRCLRSKSPPIIATGLVNIESSYPMELLCIDYLSLEVSKGGYENVLVITDHFTRYAQAFPTKNQTARTTAKVLFENFFVHYGFPEKLHSDRGQNFLSKVIQRLCKIAGAKRARTTPYHPQGNGQCERFNQTLIKMLRTLESERKSDWKSAISALVHAYNVTKCEVTGYSPYHLMFGRTPRLAIDAVLGILGQRVGGASPSEYMRQLELHLANAYKYANRCALVNADKAKQRYDIRVQEAKLLPGDRCLLRNNGIKGKHKLSDIWSSDVYVILDQPNLSFPVFRIQKENGDVGIKTVHRNHLLPCSFLPIQEVQRVSSPEVSDESSTDVDERAENTSSDSHQSEVETDTRRSKRKEIPRRCSQRQTRRPAWFTSGEYKL